MLIWDGLLLELLKHKTPLRTTEMEITVFTTAHNLENSRNKFTCLNKRIFP